MKSTLTIPAIEGKTHLGCSAEERARPQTVSIAIQISMDGRFPACESDALDSTPCYKVMSERILAVFAEKHYSTIEHLCLNCFESLQEYLRDFKDFEGAKLEVTLHKHAPPVRAITQGSHYTLKSRL